MHFLSNLLAGIAKATIGLFVAFGLFHSSIATSTIVQNIAVIANANSSSSIPTPTNQSSKAPQSNPAALTKSVLSQASNPAPQTQSTQTTTSGATVDSSVNVIQSPPTQSPTISGNQLENALATSYAQYNLSTVQSVIPEMLANLSTDQEYFDNIAKLRSLCVSEYNNQLPYFQQQEQQELEDTGRAGQSSVLIGNIKAQYQLELSDLQTTESTCLASYSSTASSTIEQIGSLTTQLSQLQQKAATNPTDLSDIDPILQNFESIYAQVVVINAIMQSPATLPPQPASTGFFDCNTQAGGFACNGAGVSMNCTALGGGSLSCASTNGQNLSCTNNGGGLSCSAY